ncbi:MAG: PilN domain-containing protein [Planctomycetaceae bacterium]
MKKSLDLIPSRLQKRLMLGHILPRWAAVWGVCVVVGLSACADEWWETRRLEIETGDRESACSEVRAAVARGEQHQARLRQLDKQRERYAELSRSRVQLTVLGVVGRSAKSSNGRLRLDQLGIRELADNSQESRPTSRRFSVDLTGTAKDDQTIGSFIRALRSARVFDSVELKSTRSATAGRNFRVQCILSNDSRTSPGNA